MKECILPLLKARLGISTGSRDAILNAVIDGIVSDCDHTHGIKLDSGRPDHVLFVLDWATWKYSHPEGGTTPRSIQFRLKNLIIQKEGRADETTNLG